MSTGTELWLFAVSLGASALGGMLGMASGIFIVPVLTMACISRDCCRACAVIIQANACSDVQYTRQKRLYADGFNRSAAHAVPRNKSAPKARNICAARATKTTTNSRRILSFEMDMRTRAPRIAPTTDPKATEPAIGATI